MTNTTPDLDSKLAHLKTILKDMGSVLVAFSGGVDSSFLLKVAIDVLGSRVAAVTASSEIRPEREGEEAQRLAEEWGVEHIIIETEELFDEEFAQNPPDRCYICKKKVFSELLELAEICELTYVVDGSNADDAGDYRPGMRASEELGVRSPLKEAGLTKADIRALSKEMGLPTWDKPASPCFATRFPYGTSLTEAELTRLKKAEALLEELGIRELRVRVHGDLARIEVARDIMTMLIDKEVAEEISRRFREFGFQYTTLDILGFRSGSMNETLKGRENNGKGKDQRAA